MADGKIYHLKLPDDFKVRPYNIFWISRNGKLQSFSNIGQLKKIYRDKKKVIADYLKKNDVEMTDEKSVKETIVFMENNG